MDNLSKKIAELIGSASNLTGSEFTGPPDLDDSLPLKVRLIGQPQQNLFGVLNGAYKVCEPLNRAFLHGYRCTCRYGDETRLFLNEGDTRKEVSPESLIESLVKLDSISKPVLIDAELNADVLEKMELCIIASDNDYEDLDWDELFIHTDYCLFTLSSTALLSMCERKALRNKLMPYMEGNYCIALVNDNLILEDDRADIDESLEKFFHGTVQVMRLPEADEAKLAELLSELHVTIEQIRQDRAKRINKLLLEKAYTDVELQIQALSCDTEKLDEAIELMNEKVKFLPTHQESACRRIRMQYTSKMRVEISEKTAGFYRDIVDHLHDEIAKDDHIQELRRMIPEYIKDQWEGEAKRILASITASSGDLQQSLQSIIEKDMRSFIQSGADAGLAEYVLRVTDLYADQEFKTTDDSFQLELVKDASPLKKYGVIASGIALIVLSHPIIGAAVAVFGAKSIGKYEQQKNVEANRQSLQAAAEELCRNTYGDMMLWVDDVISIMEKNLFACIEACYQKMMNTIVQALNLRKADQTNHEEQLQALIALKADIESVQKDIE